MRFRMNLSENEILISNYEEQEMKQELSLKPYEAIVIRR